MTENQEEKKMPLIAKLAIVFFVFMILFYCYMHFLEPSQLKVEEVPIIHSKIPDSFQGFKIVQFSDIHFGRTTNEKEVQTMVQKINECKPDIVIFTGDLFDSSINVSEKNVSFLKETLSQINSTMGKYGVMGDQDSNVTYFEEIMNDSGFEIITNKNIPIYYNGNVPIYLGGIPTISIHQEDFSASLNKEQDAFQMLIMHEPILFDEISNRVDFVFAGHTLGGLVRIPYIGGLFNLENTNNYQKGIYQKNNATLYVSNGIGTQNVSLRLFNTPSITLFRLYNF